MSGIQKENSVFFFIPEREYLGLQIKGTIKRAKYKINLRFPFLLCSGKKSTEHTEDTEFLVFIGYGLKFKDYSLKVIGYSLKFNVYRF